MTGTLVPPWFEKYNVTRLDMSVVSIVWGISIGCSMFCVATAINQTLNTWARSHRITAYIIMVWIEIVVSITIGIISWLYMRSTIGPSFEFFFFVLCLWVIQIQVLLQIIVNRIALLLPDPRQVNKIKWSVAAYVGVINLSRQPHWDRVEKVMFLIIDAGLNIYFMWLVRRNLIANGLDKYKILFWTNVALDFFSIFLDLAIILSMSFHNPFIYVQFHPLAYIIKLSIEMSLADLIAKVARASSDRHVLDELEGINCYDLPVAPANGRPNHRSKGNTSNTTNTFTTDTTATTASNISKYHYPAAKLSKIGAPSFTSEVLSDNNNHYGRKSDDLESGITKKVAVDVRRSGASQAEDVDAIAVAPRPQSGMDAVDRVTSQNSELVGDRDSQRWLRRESARPRVNEDEEEDEEEDEGELEMMRKAYSYTN
ncbi:hypothetical protein DBV05_g5363 [Lasiodiplodia theobromae]|uniref:Uncharacterized protein n=1 Tax=Lasiodiplodia theobromae TaxID=45133 RepID=A0A5N5DG38_9PEZI|nr:hypothetical protein DBV05_g5363 [Lasiodiplodia theobromae]